MVLIIFEPQLVQVTSNDRNNNRHNNTKSHHNN
jgi:hypothetical protein